MSDTQQLQQREEEIGVRAGAKAEPEPEARRRRIKHEDRVAYGAFKFLDPTTRREMIDWKGERRGGDEGYYALTFIPTTTASSKPQYPTPTPSSKESSACSPTSPTTTSPP
ncbi:hypothetical protein OCU04_011709 [Sclerotinia nivalis]|uniref:Uncharacterized protein n=1 Tax=Sclerotinia nivalis TaxID=352851 RepID=A0A9X0ACY0_9HELO|nr:hypothetical protein OCU04_011709 [Sclerotinia nivalis]